MYNLKIDYEKAKSIVKEHGIDGWIDFLNNKFPDRKLYSVSTFWYEDQKYICKAKGKYGDLLIIWD